ncbi:MAG: exo-beta-N-acetylmuramidase NamZ family protein [Fimbriiglobus sp.]
MTGLDRVFTSGFGSLAGKRVGLVTHPAARLSRPPYTIASALFAASSEVRLTALFGPEHGITGEAQDLIPVRGETGAVPTYTLYGETFESLKPTAAMLAGLDVLVIDMVDVGSRYYTFQATMLYCLEACAAVGLPVVILDRANPLGRTVEGPTIRPGFESFVGPHPIATRHGMTMGELARMYQAERVPSVLLEVLTHTSPTSFWFPPSPNMPTRDTAIVYPGMCLVEGTNLSEGRGNTRPFEYVGFPGVSGPDLARLLAEQRLPGIDFLPVNFTPTFQKHAGQSCGGVFLVPGEGFQPVRTGLAVLWAFKKLLGKSFVWRTERYEFVDTIPAIDLLFGSDRERLALDTGEPWQAIAREWEPEEAAFETRSKQWLEV